MNSNRFAEHEIVWTDEKVARLWDYYSRTPPYNEIYFAKCFGKQLIRQSGLQVSRNLSVLDFGCGPGFMWDHLQDLESPWAYTGLDFSVSSVKSFNERAGGRPRFGGAHHVTSLPSDLRSASFDVILLIEVVEHLSDEHLDSTLAEVARLLRRGGQVLVSTPNQEDLSLLKKFCPDCGCVFNEWQHVRTWTIQSLVERLGGHGLRPEFCQAMDLRRHLSLGAWILHGARRMRGRLLGKVPLEPHLVGVFTH